MAVNEEGQREVIGAAEGMKDDRESWLSFLACLKERGLTGTRLFLGDKCLGLLDMINTVPQSPIPSLNGSFIPKRLLGHASRQNQGRGRDDQGDPRSGRPSCRARKGQGCYPEITGNEARGGSQDG